MEQNVIWWILGLITVIGLFGIVIIIIYLIRKNKNSSVTPAPTPTPTPAPTPAPSPTPRPNPSIRNPFKICVKENSIQFPEESGLTGSKSWSTVSILSNNQTSCDLSLNVFPDNSGNLRNKYCVYDWTILFDNYFPDLNTIQKCIDNYSPKIEFFSEGTLYPDDPSGTIQINLPLKPNYKNYCVYEGINQVIGEDIIAIPGTLVREKQNNQCPIVENANAIFELYSPII
jgi:hypothetical protein